MIFSVLAEPISFIKKCKKTNIALQEVRESLLKKGYQKNEVDCLINQNRFWSFALLEIINIIIKFFVYKFKSNISDFSFNKEKSYVVCSNHYSHIDYLIIYSELSRSHISNYTPMAMASSHLNHGIFGLFFRNCNVAFINRNAKNNYRLIEDFLHLISLHKIPIILFPEGGWSSNGNLKSFKTGLLSLMSRNSNFEIIPVKLQSTRTIGDLKFAQIRKNKRWNTKESIYNILKTLPDIFRRKGYYYFSVGDSFAFQDSIRDTIKLIKISIENLAIYGSFEQECLSVYKKLHEGQAKNIIEKSKKLEKVFQWKKYSEEELYNIFYFSCNQYIYKAILDNHDLLSTYESLFIEENLDDIKLSDPFYTSIFSKIKESFYL